MPGLDNFGQVALYLCTKYHGSSIMSCQHILVNIILNPMMQFWQWTNCVWEYDFWKAWIPIASTGKIGIEVVLKTYILKKLFVYIQFLKSICNGDKKCLILHLLATENKLMHSRNSSLKVYNNCNKNVKEKALFWFSFLSVLEHGMLIVHTNAWKALM